MSGAFAAILPYFPDVGEPAPPSYSTEGLEPLSYELDPNGTGKSVYNPPRPDGKRSEHYDKLYQAREEDGGKPWWDLHIYHVGISWILGAGRSMSLPLCDVAREIHR